MVMGGCKGVCEGMITFWRCDRPQGSVKDVKGIRKVSQLMERFDGHVRGIKGSGEV